MLYLSCVQLVLTRNKSYYLVIFITSLLLFPAGFSVSNRMSPLGGRLARARLIQPSPPAQGSAAQGTPSFHLVAPSISSLCFLNLSLLSDCLLPSSSIPGGDDWASGGAICPAFAQPFAGDERILQVCPPLLFPYAVRDGAP